MIPNDDGRTSGLTLTAGELLEPQVGVAGIFTFLPGGGRC